MANPLDTAEHLIAQGITVEKLAEALKDAWLFGYVEGETDAIQAEYSEPTLLKLSPLELYPDPDVSDL